MHLPSQKFIKQSIASRLICPRVPSVLLSLFLDQWLHFFLIEQFAAINTWRSFLRGQISFHVMPYIGISPSVWLHSFHRRSRLLARPSKEATLCRCVYVRGGKQREAPDCNATEHRISPLQIHCTLRGWPRSPVNQYPQLWSQEIVTKLRQDAVRNLDRSLIKLKYFIQIVAVMAERIAFTERNSHAPPVLP